MNVRIFYDGVKFRLKDSKKARNLIIKVISDEGKSPGDLNFIFTSDEILRKINVEFLNHNYFTDVISFGYADKNEISGEVYISVETVKINAKNYKVSYNNEILRVIIHGTLHLCGYDDKTEQERNGMKRLEDKWLEWYYGEKNGI